MLRVVALVVVTAGIARAQPSPCGSLPADLPARTAAAEKARDASYAKALAAKKLTAWTGSPRIYSDGDEYSTPKPKPPSGDVQVIDIGDAAYTEPTVELVVDRKGTVFRVRRSPRGDRPTYMQCGCAPITHGGARVRVLHYVMELPKTVKYGGDIDIVYTDKVPIVSWTNMQGGRPCPQPP